MSRDRVLTCVPKSLACAIRCATFALQISFLLGRQLIFGHEPPIHRRSTTAVGSPAWAKCQAKYFPPSPLPTITFLKCSTAIAPSFPYVVSKSAPATFEHSGG